MGYQVSFFTVYFVLHWKYCMLLTYATAFLLVGVFLTTAHNVVRNVCAHACTHTHTHTYIHSFIHSLICLFPQQSATLLLLANKSDEFTVAISYYCVTNFDLLTLRRRTTYIYIYMSRCEVFKEPNNIYICSNQSDEFWSNFVLSLYA